MSIPLRARLALPPASKPSDTPLTDAALAFVTMEQCDELIAVARKLERDRAALLEALQAILPKYEKAAEIWQARASQSEIDAFNQARAAIKQVEGDK